MAHPTDQNVISSAENDKKTLGRRHLLRAIAATSGAVATSTMLPAEWVKPVIEVGYLPAHAQTSPINLNISGSANGGGTIPNKVPQNGIITSIIASVSPAIASVGVRAIVETTDSVNSGPFETTSFTNAEGIATFPDFDLIILGPFAIDTLITFTFSFIDRTQWGTASSSTTITVEMAMGTRTGGDTSPWKQVEN